jgi:DNA recombination protein RmuC
MDATSFIAGIAIGTALGALAAWIARGRRAARAEAQAERTPILERANEELQQKLQAKAEEATQYATRLEAEREAIDGGKKMLGEAKATLSDVFKALASDALKQNSTSFLELAGQKFGTDQQTAKGELEKRQQAIEELVKPLREQLGRYESMLLAIEGGRKEAYGKLSEQLQALSDRTGKLTLALRTPKARGRWGEHTLRQAVEMAGMVEYCDFEMEVSTQGEEGRLRPDMIVRLPGRCQFVVDAKTSLDAYMDAVETSDMDERQRHLARHAEQVARHMELLSQKAYWAQFDRSPDFVVMFLPGENFLAAAVEQRPTLIEEGFHRKVILTSPTMLVSLLRTAALAWKQERMAENAETISRMARELYERLATMGEHLQRLGSALQKSVEAYNRTVGSLETRVLPAARKFPELGVTSKKTLEELVKIEASPVAPGADELTSASDEFALRESE